MADQQATFSVVVENIVSPVYRITVGWGDMGRTWVVSLPGSMTPDAVEAVAQTMRRAVGAAIESAGRGSEQTARLADALQSANQYRDDYRRLVDERDALEAKLAAAQRLWEAMRADKATRAYDRQALVLETARALHGIYYNEDAGPPEWDDEEPCRRDWLVRQADLALECFERASKPTADAAGRSG